MRDDVESVYRQDGPRLWRALLAYSGDADIASEAMAEAFAQLLRRGNDVRDPAAWVWRAGFRIAAGELARRGREAATPNLPSDADPTAESLDLLRALRQLPHQQRSAVVLTYLVDLPAATVADILGVSQPTVRVHLMRARRALRGLLEVSDE